MKKGPPLETLKGMGREWKDALASAVCLAAAVGVRRGKKVERWMPMGDDFKPEEEAEMLAAVEKARQMFEGESPEELDRSIELYEAHLRYCGYEIHAGVAN